MSKKDHDLFDYDPVLGTYHSDVKRAPKKRKPVTVIDDAESGDYLTLPDNRQIRVAWKWPDGSANCRWFSEGKESRELFYVEKGTTVRTVRLMI